MSCIYIILKGPGSIHSRDAGPSSILRRVIGPGSPNKYTDSQSRSIAKIGAMEPPYVSWMARDTKNELGGREKLYERV